MKTIKNAIVTIVATLGAFGLYLVSKVIYMFMYGGIVVVAGNNTSGTVDPTVANAIKTDVSKNIALFAKLDIAVGIAFGLIGFAIILALFWPWIKQAMGKKGKGEGSVN